MHDQDMHLMYLHLHNALFPTFYRVTTSSKLHIVVTESSFNHPLPPFTGPDNTPHPTKQHTMGCLMSCLMPVTLYICIKKCPESPFHGDPDFFKGVPPISTTTLAHTWSDLRTVYTASEMCELLPGKVLDTDKCAVDFSGVDAGILGVLEGVGSPGVVCTVNLKDAGTRGLQEKQDACAELQGGWTVGNRVIRAMENASSTRPFALCPNNAHANTWCSFRLASTSPRSSLRYYPPTTMVDNRNSAPRKRSLRNAPPLTSGSNNARRTSGPDRRQDGARSASPLQRGVRSRDCERETRGDIGQRYQHMKDAARTQRTVKNDHYSPKARTPVERMTAGHSLSAGRNSGLVISSLHEDQTVVQDTLRNAAHTARYLENCTADTPDPFIASENNSAYLQPPQNMSQNPDLVNGILLESLRMVDYLQRNTTSDARPYRASPEVARYLEHIRERYPEALVYGRMDGQDQSLERLESVGVGESVTSPVADPEGSDGNGDGHLGEADMDWYTAVWDENSNDAAKGDV
ncbi:uncharacterized protein CC84DRAFT_1202261 [Paraphaeosphaeria sporulosa]|uniref:Uncharacterized protein n=1 Tax=Paraphaeosphaeria sporulosa TaxID=1460663 RepID=A0A177CS14_9PLEO|nr:uncharacterized protein CC84DRAFT_1202261 [Paraphaeosphaeria sporulosa]OAG09559.1 hypothetical protein CC84DRAFT_1202261 [Paraphaeosphaeria sporulosa]